MKRTPSTQSGFEDEDVRFLSENTDLSPKQARELIEENDRHKNKLLEVARPMQAEG